MDDLKYEFEQRERQEKINNEVYQRLIKLEKLADEMAYLWRCQGAKFSQKCPHDKEISGCNECVCEILRNK